MPDDSLRQHRPQAARQALLAGASGLVGRALLSRLLAHPDYHRVHAWVRRPVDAGGDGGKLLQAVVDFGALPPAPSVDDVFIALGTTLRQAGSQQAFRQVDFDAVVNTARAARLSGARRLLVVSSHGADVRSRVFYSRVKGQMQDAVITLGYDTVVFAQPSFLEGDRAAVGQLQRSSEEWVLRILKPVKRWIPASVKPIPADAVAAALLTQAFEAPPGITMLSSAAMQPMA